MDQERENHMSRKSFTTGIVALFAALCTINACDREDADFPNRSDGSSPCDSKPVGLGLYFVNGVWDPDLFVFPNAPGPDSLHIVAGHDRFLQEVYLVSRVPTTPHDGITAVVSTGNFAPLSWGGLEVAGEDWRLESNGSTWQHQVFFDGAKWMRKKSTLRVAVLDALGEELSDQTYVLGKSKGWKKHDDFFERRLNARVVSSGCVAQGDCSNQEAVHFAEGIVGLRTLLNPQGTFSVPAGAVSLELRWSEHPEPFVVPVVQHKAQGTGYGFGIQLEEVSTPSGGVYQPGETVSIRLVVTDGDGEPLFGDTLPSYAAMLERRPEAKGLRYLLFPLPSSMLYWAYKDLQAGSETFLAGPLHKMTKVATTPISVIDLLFETQVPAATVSNDGWTGLVNSTPVTPLLFACLFGDPTACEAPLDPVFHFTLPEESESGTYVIGTKLRREWMGETSHAAASIELQVGTSMATEFAPFEIPGLENCQGCHSGATSLANASHGFPINEVGPECMTCHTDGYFFEPDAGIVTRLTYLHQQSERLEPPK